MINLEFGKMKMKFLRQKKIFEGFETFKSEKKIFEENIRLRDSFTFASISQIENNDWRDEFYSASNNLVNFKYKNLNKLRFKGKKYLDPN